VAALLQRLGGGLNAMKHIVDGAGAELDELFSNDALNEIIWQGHDLAGASAA
jgi:hypothetical protein